jgi:hypothetical protein
MSRILLAGAALLVIGAFVALQVHANPLVRRVVETPIYTIGDADFAVALNKNRSVRKLGPLPLGLYRGGVAFNSVKAARRYLRESGHEADGWGVYELSGDYELDTQEIDGRRYITRTMLVLCRADAVR